MNNECMFLYKHLWVAQRQIEYNVKAIPFAALDRCLYFYSNETFFVVLLYIQETIPFLSLGVYRFLEIWVDNVAFLLYV